MTALQTADFTTGNDMEGKKIELSRRSGYSARLGDFYLDDEWNDRDDLGDLDALAQGLSHSYRSAEKTLKIPAIIVRRIEVGGQQKLKVLDGHRRYKACQLLSDPNGAYKLQIEKLPVDIAPENMSPAEEQLLLITSNSGLNRSPLEQARIIARAIDLGMSRKEISERLGQTVMSVGKSLYFLEAATPNIQKWVKDDVVSFTLAYTTLKESASPQEAEELLSQAVNSAEGKVTNKDVKRIKKALEPEETTVESDTNVTQLTLLDGGKSDADSNIVDGSQGDTPIAGCPMPQPPSDAPSNNGNTDVNKGGELMTEEPNQDTENTENQTEQPAKTKEPDDPEEHRDMVAYIESVRWESYPLATLKRVWNVLEG